MALYRIADLIIEINPKYDYTPRMCAPYEIESGTPDMRICVREDEISAEQAPDVPHSRGYLESLAIYRKIAEQMAAHQGFLAHGAVIALDGCAYMFCAPSGTGKTTHLRLWQALYPDTVVINGDKPLIRQKDGRMYAYGTPWAGKEGLQTNAGAVLCGICVLSRAQHNSITPIARDKVMAALAQHVYFPTDQSAAQTLSLLAELSRSVPVYSLCCNADADAARLSYQTLRHKE